MERKELPYFSVDGHFGGSQSWFLDPWMHIGGCGALTMCDLLLYQAICKGRRDCWPFEEKAASSNVGAAPAMGPEDADAAGAAPEGENSDSAAPAIESSGSVTLAIASSDSTATGATAQAKVWKAPKLSKRDYRKFGMIMKPYLRPRESGIKDLKTFIDGAQVYLEDSEIKGFRLEALEGARPYEEAEQAVRDRIDHEMPVPMLMLRHRDRRFDFFEWHWFLIVGYEERESGFHIKVATYGKKHWLDFRKFWDTGELERGGLVKVYDEREEAAAK